MAYDVVISDLALADAEEYALFIRDVKKEPAAAKRWFRGLVKAVYSLEELPERCPLIPEYDEFNRPLRHLLYHSHRIVFSVEGRVVTIVRVYHSSQRQLGEANLP